MIIYGIVDLKSKGIQITFPSINDDTAIRTFEHTLFAPEDSIFNRSPEDFVLFRIATFDFDTEPVVLANVERLRGGSEYGRDFITVKRHQAIEERRRILSDDTE